MKVLVTGGAGFIGSHVVDKLIEANHEVVIVDNLATGYQKNLNSKARFYQLDILDTKLDEVFSKERPEVIFHLAAQTDVQASLNNPQYDAMVNILGTVNVLEASRKNAVKKIIYASSAAGYGDNNALPLKESERIAPLSYYGVSKHTPEHYFPIYQQLYGLEYTVLRFSNAYGPRQISKGEGGVIAIFTSLLVKDQQPKIFGDGEQSRDFIYVEDIALANLKALEKGNKEIINISSQEKTTVNQLFEVLKQLSNSSQSPKYMPTRAGEIKENSLANTKAKDKLAWEPKVSLKEGLRRTIEFYKEEKLN
jgi:UDP-glucose 4-epimerase